jgi:hypothetical protein
MVLLTWKVVNLNKVSEFNVVVEFVSMCFNVFSCVLMCFHFLFICLLEFISISMDCYNGSTSKWNMMENELEYR